MSESALLRWYPLATVFPAGLDSNTDPAALKDGMSPDAYGMGLDFPGLLYKAGVPTGATPIKKTYDIGTGDNKTWTWYYRRLWRALSANLEYNSPEYTAAVLYQGIGKLSFDEDAQSLITFFPFAGDSIFVGKSTGGYRVANADSFEGNFQHGNIESAMAIATDGNGLSFNNIAYVSNSNGLFAWDGSSVKNITLNMTNDLDLFKDKTLTLSVARRRIVGGTSFVYDPAANQLYKYDGTNFRFTTRTLVTPKDEPIPCKQVCFIIRNTAGIDQGAITYQLRGDENEWREENKVDLSYTPNKPYKVFAIHTPNSPPSSSRRLTLRITDMSANLYIEGIRILTSFQSTEGGFAHGE